MKAEMIGPVMCFVNLLEMLEKGPGHWHRSSAEPTTILSFCEGCRKSNWHRCGSGENAAPPPSFDEEGPDADAILQVIQQHEALSVAQPSHF